jgi:hypothetical protein
MAIKAFGHASSVAIAKSYQINIINSPVIAKGV